ncbi:YciI family protein [Amycolatopsis sp. cg5]|uniref:YciI family protein n=1 Tax=Amycolatopsis sp. cg5 TaxID=3238802 RepID=UPI003525E8D7
MPKFVALMLPDDRYTGPGDNPVSPMDRYLAWQEELKASGRLIAAAGLGDAAKSIRGNGESVQITDGPFAEASEVIAGYLVIEAADLDEATKLLATHPVVPEGGLALVVREITLDEHTPREGHLRR